MVTDKKKYYRYNLVTAVKYIAFILLLTLIFAGNALGTCVDISDEPMETKAQSAPSNIMFVLDNSGSMDWEFMTTEANGLYSGAYYLYPDSAFINSNDRAYGDGNELNATERKEWKSQWSGYSKTFYNPNVLYSPWPRKSNADTDEPFSNPHNDASSDSKLNMDGEYFSTTSQTIGVIVDNVDSGFLLNTPAAWTLNSTSYPGDRYEDNYYHTSSENDATDDWARWTPSLPVAGNYNVYVWWTSNNNRDTTVQYQVYHNSATDFPGTQNQQNNDGGWNLLGNYDFNADGTEYVQLDPDTPGDSTYSADAMRFTEITSATPISVKNAHYFIINDLDSDGEKDVGEDIYLVNFVDSDGDGSQDDRDYYLFNDDGDDEVENGELVYMNDSSIPDRVRASNYDEDGNFVSFSSDLEDLQNFANWFSFYRKRELTAKAAVAGSIDDLEWVYVGFYSINSGLRQTVLPIKVETNDIIIDNQDSRYSESGSWSESSASNEYKDSSRYTSGNNSAQWTPDLPSADTFKVYVWYDYWDTRDTNALYTVHHAGGDFTVRINQKVDYSQWVELGDFNFDAGTSGYVTVTRDGNSTGGSTSADAVKFESTSGGGIEVDETDTLLTKLYEMDSSGNTPLRAALNNVGRYYDADDGNDGNLGSSPFADAASGGSCQQAFSIVMTDGYWNGSSPGVGNQDADTASNFDGSPFADEYDNTLADVAMKYYKEDLVNTVDDEVPTNSCDRANHQHMVTYTVSFGVTGTLTPSDYDECLLDGSTPPWPEPIANTNTTLDDLYHAAVNGRGLYFNASDPQELVNSLTDVTSNIASRMSSGASVSVNGDELNTDTVLYQASYYSGDWTGDVKAYPVDPSNGKIDKENPLWEASDVLQTIDWTERNIVTFDSDNGVGTEFKYTNLTAVQKAHLNSDLNVVDFIKGKNIITGFRTRTKKLGDIVHSAPLLVGETIYAGGNDGMLHAFDASNGEERFSYVPNLIYDNFYDETDLSKSFFKSGYEHKFFVDLTPAAKKGVNIDDDASNDIFTLLVGGFGKGGKGYYCLDITNADTKTYNSDITEIEPMVKWEYPITTDNDIGYSFSMPVIVKSNATATEDVTKKKWVVIFGNGYDSANGNAVLYILNADGTLLKKIDTGAGGCNGLSTPSVVDTNFDLRADYAYAGDLKGNLWKFDLTDPNPANWEVAHEASTGDAAPLFSAPGKPITSKPDVMQHCSAGDIDDDLTCTNKTLEGYIVTFGTGKFLNATDRISTESQYVFGIWDYGDDDDNQEYLGSFVEGGTTQLSNLDSTIALLEQTEVYNGYHGSNYLRVLSDNQPDWTFECDDTTGQNPDPKGHAGWYFELPIAGERIIKDMIIRNKNLIYITFTPDLSPCSGGGNSIIHEVNACTGGRLSYAQFDITDDRKINSSDLIDIGLTDEDGNPILVPPTGLGRPGMLHNPVFIQFPGKPVEMKIFSSSAGTTETIFENKEPRGMFYWQLIE